MTDPVYPMRCPPLSTRAQQGDGAPLELNAQLASAVAAARRSFEKEEAAALLAQTSEVLHRCATHAP